MYAVFEDGSRQYNVSVGQTVKVDWRDTDIGGQVEFKRVLLLADGTDVKVGQPTVEGVRVVGEVVDHPSTKLYIQHFRRRKNYRRLRGHRQHYTAVRIKHILLPGQEPPVTPPPAPPGQAPAPETAGAQAPAAPPVPVPPPTAETSAPPVPAPAPTPEMVGAPPQPPAPTPETAGPQAPAAPPVPAPAPTPEASAPPAPAPAAASAPVQPP